MSGRVVKPVVLGALLVIGGIALLGDPKCKCGCRSVAEHLLKVGFGLLSGQPS